MAENKTGETNIKPEEKMRVSPTVLVTGGCGFIGSHIVENLVNEGYKVWVLDNLTTLVSAYGEAFPMVVGEAMSCGVPCVVTDVGDSGWIVGNTGKVVPPRNPEALANAWQELIEIGDEQRQVLGAAARSRVRECFALELIAAQYEKLYEQALSKKQLTPIRQ
jgi:glycosyltransferase involved in cell wall biosynthesis